MQSQSLNFQTRRRCIMSGEKNLSFLEQLIRVWIITVLQKHVINNAKQVVCLLSLSGLVLGFVFEQNFPIAAFLKEFLSDQITSLFIVS